MKKVLAFDFGASSGRAIIGEFKNGEITLKEVHRFTNDPVSVAGTTYWDVLRLFHEIKQGIIKAKQAGGFDSIGIDTWGVDFGLIDEHGCLLENPIHYRDTRTVGMIEQAEKYISKREMYDITGIQFMELNTVFQLLALKEKRPHMLERADKVLFMSDLFSYMLTGQMNTEYSIATTSQLIDLETNSWSEKLLDKLGIDKNIFAPLVKSGTRVGMLRPEICEECGVESVPVIAVCEHDTQSAISAVPCPDNEFAFISSGTWSLFGTELEKYVVNDTTYEINVTNEGGFDYSVGFLKNIIGLWLIQESRRQWAREGENYSYAELEKSALAAEPFKCFIDPDAPEFVPHGNIPRRVREYCKRTNQYVPETVGEIMRCIYESLAMKYRETFDKIKECTGKDYPVIHVIGGGTKDTLLCQLTANSCGVEVKAGPIEATVLGNIAVQLISAGEIESIKEARKIISESENVVTYAPEETNIWSEKFEQYKNAVK